MCVSLCCLCRVFLAGSIFNKLIDEQGHLDMRNVTTLIWVNRKRPDIVETIVELLIEVWCGARAFGCGVYCSEERAFRCDMFLLRWIGLLARVGRVLSLCVRRLYCFATTVV